MNTFKQSLLFKCIFLVFFFYITNFNLSAQDYSGTINYQAALRDNDGNTASNRDIKVRVSIYTNDSKNELVWQEEHTTTTNKLGLFFLKIGSPLKTSGSALSFSEINWSKPYNLRIDIAIGTGSYEHFGTNPLVSVPYALYAKKAGSATPDFSKFTFDATSNTLKNDGSVIANLTSLSQSLEYDPTSYHLSISGRPGIVDLRQFAHAPQDLRILNNKVWITGNKDSTVVDLSPYKQTLSVNSTSKLQISGGNEVQVDTSNTNEIQTLSLLNNKLSLNKGGGEVTIDASETNEIQDLSLSGNTLKVTNNSTATNINLSKYLDNTDNQTLERSGSNLSITGGNQVDVSDMINLPWTGFSSNNLSNQALPGLAETLITWSEEFDSGNVLDNNRFIAPANGIYNLSFSMIFTTANFTIRVYKNSDPIPLRSFDSFGLSFSHTMLLNLQQNDNILIKVYSSFGSSLPLGTSYFSGFRVK